jgi:hypothetical protein
MALDGQLTISDKDGQEMALDKYHPYEIGGSQGHPHTHTCAHAHPCTHAHIHTHVHTHTYTRPPTHTVIAAATMRVPYLPLWLNALPITFSHHPVGA